MRFGNFTTHPLEMATSDAQLEDVAGRQMSGLIPGYAIDPDYIQATGPEQVLHTIQESARTTPDSRFGLESILDYYYSTQNLLAHVDSSVIGPAVHLNRGLKLGLYLAFLRGGNVDMHNRFNAQGYDFRVHVPSEVTELWYGHVPHNGISVFSGGNMPGLDKAIHQYVRWEGEDRADFVKIFACMRNSLSYGELAMDRASALIRASLNTPE